ncbi:hypothetical protein LRS74_13210 [Streptomyces sp. LX-29]|uniref:hypothetical protein n=1 Tax=Streptomyces sp. LX-29 TaxID=2900152 RepID=UPI00240D7A5D|nr:hypothetical protein [Streptomyces sp. LX-29]WFB07901.1 hypothetical protein LRS74_13210 [Streptomyces sp. LX-29]
MRLNHADGVTAGGGSEGLVVYQDDLGQVGHEAHTLHTRLRKAGDVAQGSEGDGSTAKAAATLTSHGFAMGGALTTTAFVWRRQVETLLQACAHISNHLDYTKQSTAREDAKIAASLRYRDGSTEPVSEILTHFR